MGDAAPGNPASSAAFNPATTHLPPLDGLRALAIILVILVHAFYRGPDLDPGPLGSNLLIFGWTGVDLFFVLSGFLITSNLLESKGKPAPFRTFYVKRIGRIFPLYYAILLGFLALSLVDHPKIALQVGNFTEHAWAYFTFTSNLGDLLGLGLNNPMGPTWSLAVEEQYYLVWPFLVLGLTPKKLGRAAVALLLGLTLARYFLVGELAPDAIYSFTLTHADGVLTGSIIAIYRDEVFARRRYVGLLMLVLASALMAIFLVAGTTHYQDPTVQRFAFLPIALFYGSFLILALATAPLARLLSVKPLRLVGRYSFFIYLTHLPLLILLDQLPLPGGLLAWLAFVAVFTAGITALGHLSWTLFEYPVAQAIRRQFLPHPHRRHPVAQPLSAAHD